MYSKFIEYRFGLEQNEIATSNFTKWLIAGQGQIDITKAKMYALKAATFALNVGFSLLASVLLTKAISAWQEYSQRIETAATKSKEAADAAKQTTSSLKELVDTYEELGDKSEWDSDSYNQAKDIQEQILDVLKDQNSAIEDKLGKIDLANGKYQEQLGILKDITAEQLRNEHSDLKQDVVAQGDLLVKTAKKNTSQMAYVSGGANSSDGVMASKIANAIGGTYNSASGSFSLGSMDLNDPKSIAEWYDKINQALKIFSENSTEAQMSSSGLYQWLVRQKNGLQDQVEAYNDSTDAMEDNELQQRKLETVRALANTNARALNGALATLQNTIDGFDASTLVNLLNGIGTELLTPDQQAALDKIREFMTAKGFTTEQIQAFVDVLAEIGRVSPSAADGIDEAAAAAKQAAEDFEEANKRIDNLQSAYQTMSACVDEYNKNGWVTVDNLQALSQLEPQYLACLEKRDGQMSINTESVQKLAEAEIDLYRVSLLNNTIQGILATTSIEKANQILGQAQSDMSQSKQMLRDAKKQALQDAYEKYGSGDEFYAIRKAINQQIDSWENLDELWLDLKDKDPSTYLSKTSSASKSTSKSVSDAASAFDTLVSAMKEYNQYGYVSANTAKSLAGLEDKYTACLTKQNGKLVLNTAKFKDYIKQQIVAANAADDDGKSAYELAKILSYLNDSVDSETISFEQLTDAIKGYGTAMDDAKEKTDAIKSAFSGLSEISKNKIENPFGALDADDVDKKYQAIRDLYDNTDLFTDERFAGALNSENGEIDYNSDAFKQMFLEKLDSMATACEETGGVAGKYLAQGFRDAEDKIKNNVISIEEYINGIGSTLENINNRMDNFQSAFNDLSDIVDEYNAYGNLSQDSIQKLMSLDVKYTACLDLQGDKLVFNKEAFRALYVEQLRKLAADYEGTEIGKRYAEILQKVADGTWDVTNHMKGMDAEADKLQTIFSNLKDLFSSLLDVFNKFNDNNSNDLKIYGDAMTEEIDKRIEALQDANDEQEKAIELAKLQAELEKAETQKTVRVYTSNGYEWQADESAIKEARDNLNSKQREDALNDEIDKLNKLKDKYTELINLIGSSYEDYQKKQEYAAKIQGMTFDQMTAGLDGYKDNVIASMKAIQGATNVNNVVTNLTNLVNTLVKLNDVLNGLSTGTTQSGGITGLFNRLQRAIGTFSDKSSGKGFWGRLLDAGKSILGIGDGSASSKLTTDIAPVIKSGVGDGITTGLDAAKPSIAKSAQGIFSGNGGLKSIFQKGFSGVASIAQKAVGGLGSIFGDIGTTLGETKLFSGIAGIFKGIGKTVSTVIGTTGGTGVAGTIAAAVSHIPVIGKILLGGTLAVGAIGGGSLTTGIKRIGTGITNVVKGIGSTISKAVKGVGSFISKLMPWNWGKSSSDSGSKKKGIGSWKIWPWNWGRAKGDKHINQAAPYNVDEEGEEIIVRNPAKGRMTYLEKGDGVIPADTTENLMEIGKDPKKWLSDAMKESSNSVGSLPIDDLKNAKTKGDLISITKSLANNQMKRLRDKFDTVWKRLGKNAGLSEEQIDTIGSTIFDRMGSMISNSMDSALGNKNLTDDQIKTICAEMFQRMGSVYKNGWDNLYSLSPDMSTDASTAINKLFETIFADYNADTSNISDVISGWLPKVENTMNTTPAPGLSGGGGYYGNSMDANVGPSASFSFSKVKKTIQGLFEKFSNSKLGAWINKHSLGSAVDKLTKYNESNDPNMVQKALHLLTHPTELIASAVESAVKTGKKVTWAVTHPKEAAQEIASAAKDAYNKGKEVASKAKDAVTHPKETAEKIVDKVKETYNNIKEAVSEKTNSAKNWVKDKVDKITGKKATGSRSINKSGTYNVDEKGQELIVRQPEAGRYTYLETGDGVVPADITSKLFDLGGNPDKWFQEQLAKNGGLTANVQNHSQAPSISIGDIYVQKPIGDVDSLAREIVQGLPNAIYQECSKR